MRMQVSSRSAVGRPWRLLRFDGRTWRDSDGRAAHLLPKGEAARIVREGITTALPWLRVTG